MNYDKKIAVIPARFASQRLPGKPLKMIGDKPMLQRVYENILNMSLFDEIIVATDHEDILSFCLDKKIPVEMTSSNHASGTDRVAEVVKFRDDIASVVNVQGDEPFVEREMLCKLLKILSKGAEIATLCRVINTPDELNNENLVKVVRSYTGKCLYFSRAPIPHLRNEVGSTPLQDNLFMAHIGLYGFKRETLLALQKLSVSPLESAEKLEQLRWLENDFIIESAVTEHTTKGIDTLEDLEWANHFVTKINKDSQTLRRD